MTRLFCAHSLISVLLLFVNVALGEVRIESGPLNGTTIPSAQFYKKGDDFTSFFTPISGYMALSNETTDITGMIVVLDFVAVQAIYQHFFDIQDRGAIAILYNANTLVPGQYFCTYTGEDVQQLVIPVSEVSSDAFQEVHDLLARGEHIYITLTSEGNAWTDLIVNNVATIIVFRFLLSAISVGLIGFALYKLILFVKAQGSTFNVPQVCLGLEIISNMWRVIYFSGDPFGCFFNYGSAASSFLDTISVPYTTATFVLITFYWHEAVSDTSIKIYPFLSKLQIPFFVIMLVIIGVDITVSLLGYFYGADTSVLTIIYIVISVGFIVFYFVTVGKLMRRMQKSQAYGRREKRLTKVNQKMILNGITKFLLVIVGVIFAVRSMNATPVPQYVLTAVLGAVIDIDSFARIYLFEVRKKSSSSKASHSQNSVVSTNMAVTASVEPTTLQNL
jgi:hypothetical protein